VPVLIGTSGWQYRDWRGVFYPQGLPARCWLEHYASQYATVENNASFYRLPAGQTFVGWRERTPAGFVMAVKASRYLTHVKRLRDPAEPVARLLTAAAGLGGRLGPVLLQLPPTLRADPPLLARCLAELARFPLAAAMRSAGADVDVPAGGRLRVAVEPRHPSWWTAQVRQVLADHDAALCWADRLGQPVTPLWRTAGWGYLRCHEGTAQPWPRYEPGVLHTWARRLAQAWPGGEDVYVYFNNDPGTAAVTDSAIFAGAARAAGLTVTATPPAPG
jgi:uncharacterized protein YecE (DUF72 family)